MRIRWVQVMQQGRDASDKKDEVVELRSLLTLIKIDTLLTAQGDTQSKWARDMVICSLMDSVGIA